MAMVPLFVLPLGHLFSDEKLVPRALSGVSLGFVGALVLFAPGLTGAMSQAGLTGQLACVAAALCYAVASVVTRRCPRVDPISFAAVTLLVGAVPLIPAMLIFEGVPGTPRHAARTRHRVPRRYSLPRWPLCCGWR